MNDRLKAVRIAKGLTQQEFADRLGIKRGTIANYELGRNEPIDAVVTLICRTYNVDETWLRTGEGEMFTPRSREDEIDAYMGRLLSGKCSDIETAIVSVMARTSLDEWKIIEKKALELVEEINRKKPGQ